MYEVYQVESSMLVPLVWEFVSFGDLLNLSEELTWFLHMLTLCENKICVRHLDCCVKNLSYLEC